MRISDWSSDVCSSDLNHAFRSRCGSGAEFVPAQAGSPAPRRSRPRTAVRPGSPAELAPKPRPPSFVSASARLHLDRARPLSPHRHPRAERLVRSEGRPATPPTRLLLVKAVFWDLSLAHDNSIAFT